MACLLKRSAHRAITILTTAAALTVMAQAQTVARTPAHDAGIKLATEMFKQLIEINTTDCTTAAAEAMAKRLRDAGFPARDVVVMGPNPCKGNMVARLHGTGARKPVLLIGHLDVVKAKRSDWSTDPFQFIEKEGYYYGRGTQDMKDGDAIMMAALIHMKQEGYQPNRDIIVALTADEEGGAFNGVDWLVKNHRDLVDAAFVLNHDGGRVVVENGKVLRLIVDAAERVNAEYRLSSLDSGGPGPSPDNAIHHLTDALERLDQYTFPFELNSVTRAELAEMMGDYPSEEDALIRAVLKEPPDQEAIAKLSAGDLILKRMLRTTCASPPRMGTHVIDTADIYCSVLPGHSREEVRRRLVEIVADPRVTVAYVQTDRSITPTAPNEQQLPPADLSEEVMKPLREVSREFWPRVPVVPHMAIGGSDSQYTYAAGMPSYGVQGVAIDSNDIRWHGNDERLPVQSFDTGVQFFYCYLKALTSGK